MYNYAASSANASKVSTFTQAPTIVNPATTTTQAAAVAAAQASPAASIQESLQGFFNQVTGQLGALGSPSAASQAAADLPILTEIWFLLTGQTSLPTNLGTFMAGYSNYASFFYNTEGLPYFSVGMGNFGVQIAKSAGWIGGAAPAAAAAVPAIPALPGPAMGGALGAAGGGVAAGLGDGAHIGHLAVPASWPGASTAPPAVRPAVEMISEPITSGESGAGNVLSGMPVAGGGNARGVGAGPRYGFKPTVMPRPLGAG